MAQLPFELQKLPPQALDVLRFFAQNGNVAADDYDIMEGADLSERSFSKAIKRLVTKKFAEMDSARMYTLTDKGVNLMNELAKYDQEAGNSTPQAEAAPAMTGTPTQCRLTVVLPEPLIAGEETQVFVGLDGGLEQGSTNVFVRLSMVNGTPQKQEETLPVMSSSTHTAFKITAEQFTQARLRIEALQADEYSGDLHIAGGMYVDVDVSKDDNSPAQLAAFGTDVTVLPV